MKRNPGNEEQLERIVAEALGSIRDSQLDPRLEQEATERVWRKLQAESRPAPAEPAQHTREIRSCDDFRSLIDEYLGHKLPPARALLVKDHFGECVPCRRALKSRRAELGRPAETQTAAAPGAWRSRLGWRAAAAAVIFLAVYGLSFKTDVLSFESGGLVRVDFVEGELFKLTDEGSVPVSQGETVSLEPGEGLRTAKGSTALLRLADDSQVEVRERSELAVLQRNHLVPGRRDDGVIDLERGSIIVEASDQGSGHLYVDTTDCNVAVTGTVFAVNHGAKGSRVSVVEGEVRVAYGATRDVLAPGQQATTSAALQQIPVEDDIAWSQNHEQYVALLREVRALSREVQRVLQPGLRYSTELLDLAPAQTAVFVAMPNVSNGLGEAWELVQSRVAASPVLREAWDRKVSATDAAELGEVFSKIREYGDQIGEEILLTVPMGDDDLAEPLFLARVNDPAALAGLLRADLARLGDHPQDPIAVFEGELPAAEPAAGLFFWIGPELLAVSPSFESLRTVEAIDRGQLVSLAGSPLHGQLSERYRAGVEWLVAIDLEQILGREASDPALIETGFADLQYIIAERRQQGDRTEVRADLTFARERQRMAAWLAEPAPLGSLNYIGPDASFVAAFAMKDLETLVDELFQIVGIDDHDFAEELARFESEQGIDVRQDVAAPLGGEFAVALDGPMLPSPSWKMVVEVYDPQRLQQTIEWVVERINREVGAGNLGGIELTSDQSGGRTFLRLASLGTGLEAHIVFDEGYLIAAPSRGLLDRALRTRASGIHIAGSPGFRELLPADGKINFSGVLYHNLGPVLGPLSGALGSLSELAPEQQALIRAMSQEAVPALALIYGERDRISVVASSEGGLLGVGLDSLTGFGSVLGMQQSLVRDLADASADGYAEDGR